MEELGDDLLQVAHLQEQQEAEHANRGHGWRGHALSPIPLQAPVILISKCKARRP